MIGMYNNDMNGTDGIDQQISYYRIRLRTRHWKRKIYAHVINCMMCNAHILYKLENPGITRENKNFTLLGFIRSIIDDFAGIQKRKGDVSSADAMRITKRSLSDCLLQPSRLVGVHIPVLARNNDGKEHRRFCKVCDKRVSSSCATCDIALCFSEHRDDAQESCFAKFHN